MPKSNEDRVRDLVRQIKAMPEDGRGVDDVVHGVLRCVEQVDDDGLLEKVRAPMLRFHDARTWVDRPGGTPNAGHRAVGVAHATVRLLTALGDVDVEVAARVAKARVDALDPSVRRVPGISATTATKLANVSGTECRQPIEHLAALLDPVGRQKVNSKGQTVRTIRREEAFDLGLIAIEMAAALAWIDEVSLRAMMPAAAGNVIDHRQLVWARAAAEVDWWCGGAFPDYSPTDEQFGRLLSSAWTVVSGGGFTPWRRDLERWAGRALNRTVAHGWGTLNWRFISQLQTHGYPLSCLPGGHPLYVACYQHAHAVHYGSLPKEGGR